MPSIMKPTPISVRTYRGTGKNSFSQDEHEYGHSFVQPYLVTKKPESEKQNPSSEKVGLPSKSSEQIARKPRPVNRTSDDDDDNELVKYMSNLPCFLQQQMEKETNVQEKALNFGVLDWKRLEKWKYTERMPVKYSSQKIVQDSKKQSSSHIRNPSSGKTSIPHGSRFGSPKKERNVMSKGKETCDQESIGTVRLRDHFHQRVKSYDESKKSDPSKSTMSEKEPSHSNSNNSSDPQNIVLIKPKHFPKSSSESCPFTEMVGNRLSDFLSPQELKSGELHTEAASPSSFLEASYKKRDDIPEHVNPKERAPSPMRRLSFDLGKMSRSLSFKDNSMVPQLDSTYTSVKSGPARPEIPSGIDKFKSDRATASGRARSSPLRRLLDPLMKRKGPHHPAETETVSSPGSKGLSHDSKPVRPTLHKGPPQDRKPDEPTLQKSPTQVRKPDGSTLQALLQLTFKNGLPFFKLVVNSTNDMLAAAVKRLPTTSEKADPCLVYAFYSVREIKKKGTNWMNQGPKSKSCGLGYNIVGQMNISSSGECESRECVLYGIDPGQVDKQTLDYVPDFNPSPPLPPPPPSPSSFSSFPANISSISVPRPSRPKSANSKLIIAAIAAVVAAVTVVSLAVFLHLRRRTRNHGSSSSDKYKTQRSDSSSTISSNLAPPGGHHIPKLQRPSQNSSEFLYLGTLVSSHAPGGAVFNNVSTSTSTANNNLNNAPSESRKTDSPELRPLPPLNTQPISRVKNGDVVSSKDDESEEFYSPKGSRESSIGTGSASRRAFAALDVGNFINESTSHSSSTCASSVPGSGTGSPARSISLSLSPANNLTRSNSIPKSPDLVEIQKVEPLPAQMPSPACSPSSERYFRSEESSPRISNSSEHYMEPPAEICTTVIPTPPVTSDTILPESPSAISSPDRYSRRSEGSESSPRISNVSDHIMESPASISSSVKQSIPTSPEIKGLMLPECSSALAHSMSSLRISNVSDQNVESPARISSPVTPERCSTKIHQSSPRISNASDQNIESPVRISSPIQHMYLLSLPGRYSTSEESSSPRSSIDSDQNIESPTSNSSPVLHYTVTVLPMPPPPPPPPPMKVWESPKTPTPPLKKPTGPPAMIKPLRPMALESPTLISPIELPSNDARIVRNEENHESLNKETECSSEDTLKPKLKPLHWDKVRASSDREMVWDQFKCSSFKLNEEMIETLFVVNTPNQKSNLNETTRWQVLPSPGQDSGNRVLDPKKAQNIAILLKALHVTVDEVCEGLLEGNADILGTELLESLLKMAPSKEEERKLLEYKEEGDSPTKLGAAERFLKAVVDIPYAFKRVDTMLYVSNFDSEVEYLKNSFTTLEAACEELRTSRMFLKLLEAVLKTGNRMNVGTNRGDAHAFKLDTLLKLVDVKGADGKTTLLHFVVQEIIRSEGARLSSGTHHENSTASTSTSNVNDDAKCRKLGLQVVSALGSELSNVKKAAVMDAEVLNSDVSKLSKGIDNVKEIVIKLNDYVEISGNKFSDNMSYFMKRGEEDIFRVRAHESLALSLVKEITEYFHGNSAKEEAHPFRIFTVVRDFLAILDRVCKEVGMINERTMVSSAHKFPVPVNPMLQ